MLNDDEIARIKAELGFHLLTNSAEPVVGFTSVFTEIIRPNLTPAGEVLVRETLASIAAVKAEMAKTKGRGALKEITGDLGWHDTGKTTAFANLTKELEHYRRELATQLGLSLGDGGSRLAVH